MTRAALVAEKMDHHPEWFQRLQPGRRRALDARSGGLTELDVKLATGDGHDRWLMAIAVNSARSYLAYRYGAWRLRERRGLGLRIARGCVLNNRRRRCGRLRGL